jgi:hypothetical protein
MITLKNLPGLLKQLTLQTFYAPNAPNAPEEMMRFRVAAMWMVLVLLLTSAARADEFRLTPSVAVRQEYNSNFFFDSSNEKDDFITRVRSGLELIECTERIDLRLAGFVTPYVYWENDELNSVVQDYSGRVDYRLTPLWSAGANAAVRVGHQPDRDIYTTGLADAGARYTDSSFDVQRLAIVLAGFCSRSSRASRPPPPASRRDETIQQPTAAGGRPPLISKPRSQVRGFFVPSKRFLLETICFHRPFDETAILNRFIRNF